MALPAQSQPLPAWRTIRTELRQQVGDSTYEIWLAPIEVKGWDGELLLLEAPAATRSWVSDRFGRVLERCAQRILGTDTRVSLDERRAAPAVTGHGAHPARRGSRQRAVQSPRYSFEQFIIGDGNRLAHGAALAVAELPGQAYNPLFLYAPPGLGKTHLLHAIGNYMLAFGGGATVRYTTAESFTNDFITALGSRSLSVFKHAYRDADVLLIDDVQFLARKARTEEEFFHTFNALYEAGRQLVLTCDRLPRSLLEIEERLRERFEAGLVADIAPPDHATRVAILRKRAALDGVSVADPAVLELIADRVTTNIRALEGALIRVVAYHSLTQRPDRCRARDRGDRCDVSAQRLGITLDRRRPGGCRRPSLADRRRADLASRTARVAWPRQVAIHLARELTGASLQAIGQAFGGRNHGTVLHACKRVSERLAGDQYIADELHELSTEISSLGADRAC